MSYLHRYLVAPAFVGALALAAACTVGEPYATGNGDGNGDGDGNGGGGTGSGGGGGGGPDAGGCEAEVVQGIESGHHNPGLTCVAAGCHDGNTPLAPLWTAAGTFYLDAAGSAPLPGTTVTITDAANKVVEVVSGANGNFWTEEDLTFPLTILAERCGLTASMPDPVPAGSPSCNVAGCHEAANRIHFP
jgi:hypothetical protein